MLVDTEMRCSVTLLVSPSLEDRLELSRLVAAAVVSPAFCRRLLQDPLQALEDGYQGETFSLSDSARSLLLFLHADSLADLARQMVQTLGMGLAGLASI